MYLGSSSNRTRTAAGGLKSPLCQVVQLGDIPERKPCKLLEMVPRRTLKSSSKMVDLYQKRPRRILLLSRGQR